MSFQRRGRKSGERSSNRAARTHTCTKFLILRGHSSQGPKTVTIKPPRSLITDHNSKCNSEKLWNIVRITKMWHRDVKWANSWKNGTNRLAWSGVITNLQFVKNAISARPSKTSYACIWILFCLHASKRIFSKNLSESLPDTPIIFFILIIIISS